MRLRRLFALAALIITTLGVAAQPPQMNLQPKTINLDTWEFSQDGENWQTVNIPHDWAISGPFDKKWDLQTVAIVQNGEEEATEKSGRSGSLPWIGEGWYKTTISVGDPRPEGEPRPEGMPEGPRPEGMPEGPRPEGMPEGPRPQGGPRPDGPRGPQMYAELQFDGAMSEPTVYVNGQEAGHWAYGYNAFRLDVSELIRPGENEIMVHLQNVEESSRWYPGAGLYRPVALRLTNKQHIDQWATFVSTEKLEPSYSIINVRANVCNATRTSTLAMKIRDDRGRLVKNQTFRLGEWEEGVQFLIARPRVWSPEEPRLYTLELTASDGRGVVDTQTLKFGIRTVNVSAEKGFELNGVSREKGFELNGVSRKIKGVCLHHDLGPLGAAVNKAALIRQVKILKDMGCDAIRTSHNMPSTMQMEVYDSLGIMVMAESFDMWIYPKCKNGYAKHFEEWGEKDITNLVLNHRNHPSCVMWSIGNEIPEQWDSNVGVYWAKKLQDLCHELDPTRPVTQGLDQVRNALTSGFAEVMDIVGLNYRDHEYLNAYNSMPHGFILGSETASTVSSRGIYKATDLATNKTYDDGQCTAYDTEYCWWSNLPEVDFALQEDYPWTIGQFVWTGFDYLGEPTPYDEYWPSRSSYFGIMDLAGLPKDRFYLYRSVWNTDEHTVHLLPHWNWSEGETVPVYCYTDGESAELFVNGVSQGRIYKDRSKTIQDIDPDSVNVQPLLDRYRLRWHEVKYVPGEIKVVAYDKAGNEIGTDIRRTAGEAVAFKLEADREYLKADGNDLVYVTVSLVDANGTELPMADDQVDVSVSGGGQFRAICNGDPTSLEVFTEPTMKLFAGKLVVTLQAGTSEGEINMALSCKSKGILTNFSIKVTN